MQREDLLEGLTLSSCIVVSEDAMLLFRSGMLHAAVRSEREEVSV